MTLTNEEVAIKCTAAQARYAALKTTGEIKLAFSYEFQGFAASMIDLGFSLSDVNASLFELMAMLNRANRLENE